MFSPMNELNKYSVESKKLKKDRKKKIYKAEVSAFTSKTATTMKSKVRSLHKQNSKLSLKFT